ncbi:MAG TPA: hypothetical protein VGJ20_03030 [Xanthobacteraceae bacterium]|jgi:hypothetical protein
MSRHRRSALRLAIIGVALAVALVGGRAEDASLELARIVKDSANQQAVTEFAREQNGQLPGACDKATYNETSRALVLSPPQVDGSGKLIAGAWLQSVIATGCGTSRQLNMLTSAQPDGTLRRIALLPGTTIADPQLQRDGIQFAMGGVGQLMPPDCRREARVVETRFVEFEGPPASTVQPVRAARPWREDWTVEGCGKRVVVPVHFIPDPTGTTIRTSTKEAHPG